MRSVRDKTAIALAKRQGARGYQLLASLALAKLYRTTSRLFEAHALLAPELEGFSPTPAISPRSWPCSLFTESTLTAVLPLLVRRDRVTWLALLRFWAIVLGANILGTLIFARLIAIDGLFPEPVRTALGEIGRQAVSGPFWPTAIKAVFAGWLIALMIWLLPSARSARLLVIMLLTYVVAIGSFSHIIAGSVEAAFAVFAGEASMQDYLTGFFVPTIIGNTVGGVALVALLNHAPLAPELQA